MNSVCLFLMLHVLRPCTPSTHQCFPFTARFSARNAVDGSIDVKQCFSFGCRVNVVLVVVVIFFVVGTVK